MWQVMHREALAILVGHGTGTHQLEQCIMLACLLLYGPIVCYAESMAHCEGCTASLAFVNWLHAREHLTQSFGYHIRCQLVFVQNANFTAIDSFVFLWEFFQLVGHPSEIGLRSCHMHLCIGISSMQMHTIAVSIDALYSVVLSNGNGMEGQAPAAAAALKHCIIKSELSL